MLLYKNMVPLHIRPSAPLSHKPCKHNVLPYTSDSGLEEGRLCPTSFTPAQWTHKTRVGDLKKGEYINRNAFKKRKTTSRVGHNRPGGVERELVCRRSRNDHSTVHNSATTELCDFLPLCFL